MWELKMEREQREFRFELECLNCGGKEKSYHRLRGRREYYGWHIVGGDTVMAHAGPRPDKSPAWINTMGTNTLRWHPGPYKFWFQVKCLMSQTYREPPEQAKYIQEMQCKKLCGRRGTDSTSPRRNIKGEKKNPWKSSYGQEGGTGGEVGLEGKPMNKEKTPCSAVGK